MLQPHSMSDQEQVVETMIGLTHLTHLQRAIVAGNGSQELYLALRRRGLLRVATTLTCRLAKRQHTVGLIAGRNAVPAIEAALGELSPFLGSSAAISVLIDSREIGAGLRIRERMERMGFRIEAGVRCQQGLVLSAIRRGFGRMQQAA
jgi:hypothetical protein